MSVPTDTLQRPMTVDEFLAWPGDGSAHKVQLVDGRPRAMPLAPLARGMLLVSLSRLLGDCFASEDGPRRAVMSPAVVPRVKADTNLRIADLGVTDTLDHPDHRVLPDPIFLVEVLWCGNEAETWANVWAHTTIPSVREILVLHSTRIAAELLRRQTDGTWPERPLLLGPDDDLRLDSVGFAGPLAAIYARTGVTRPA